MPAAYQIRIHNTLGQLQAVLDLTRDVRDFVIERRVNYYSQLTLNLYELANAVQYFTTDALIEVRRRYPEAGLGWYTEYIGFHRTPQRQITSDDNRIFTSYGRGLLDLINRRSIRYYADTNGSAKGPAPADDIIKTYVRENAGPLAQTSNGRLTNGVTPGLSVSNDLSQAVTIETAHAWDNLLEAIRDIGEPNKVDFDVVWLGGANFEFRTYCPFLGTDRRVGTANPFVFAPNLGNMFQPSHTVSRTDEVTSVLVLGPGESVDRDTTLRTSPRMNDSRWNLIELDQSSSNEERQAALEAIGDSTLYEKRAAVSVNFSTIQTPLSSYGMHYNLGDIVTCTFSNVTANVKIRAVNITVNDATEQIALELEEVV